MVRVSGPSHVTAHGPLSSRLARSSLAGMLTHPPLIDGLIGTLPASVRGRGVPCPHESDRLRRRLVPVMRPGWQDEGSSGGRGVADDLDERQGGLFAIGGGLHLTAILVNSANPVKWEADSVMGRTLQDLVRVASKCS